MSLFGELDIAGANANPYFLPDDTYRCKIIEANKRIAKSSGKPGLSLTYQVVEGPKKGRKIKEWKTIPYPYELEGYKTEEDYKKKRNKDEELAENAERQKSFLKQRMVSLGIPDEKMNSVESKDFLELGLFDVTIKNADDRVNVQSVKAVEGENADPFA
jgi:hypothetical protein